MKASKWWVSTLKKQSSQIGWNKGDQSNTIYLVQV